MERIEKPGSKVSGLKKLGTGIALVGALLTQNPQESYAQKNNTTHPTEEVINDSTIHGEFTPEFIESLGSWRGKTFFINPSLLRKDENGNEYLSINGNNYYNLYITDLENYSGFGYTWLGGYCSTPNGFFIGVAKNNRVGSNGILIQPNGDHYQGGFDDELYEGRGTMDFGDGRHYEGIFHEGKMEGKGCLSRKNGEYYEGDFHEGKRHGEGKMYWKNGEKYEGTWGDDLSIGDPRDKKNPVIPGKGTYTYYGDQTTYEVSKGERPDFISVKDEKGKENWDNKRGTIVYIVKNRNGNKTYELHSWNRDISYREEDNHFIFSCKDGAELKFHTNVGERKVKAIANLINSVMSMVNNNDEGYSFFAFDYQKDDLQAQYRGRFFDTNIVKNIPGKIGISAKEFSDWLNHYRKDKPDWKFDF